jgi:hypothetical protein
MTAPGTTLEDVLIDRPRRRIAPRKAPAVDVESTTISALAQALAEAELRAASAQQQLDAASRECERRGEALHAVADECQRIHADLPIIESTARKMVERSEQERRGLGMLLRRREQERRDLALLLRRREEELEQQIEARERLEAQLAEQQRVHGLVAAQLAAERERVALVGARLAADAEAVEARCRLLHEQAADAIRIAEERATSALHSAQEIVGRARQDADERLSQARQDADERLSEAQLGVEDRLSRQRLEAEARAEMATQEQLDLRLMAEARACQLQADLDEARRALARRDIGPSDGELMLRAELEQTESDKAELRTRLALCVHELREREDELERERRLADEATRWASRVERSLMNGDAPGPATASVGHDITLRATAGPPIPAPRRFRSRVRIRPGR